MQGHNRYKTLPATPTSRPNRYKTLPAQQKTPISAHSRRAGRKLSRSRRKQPEQGELFPADHHPRATQRTLTGTKLSQQPPPQGQTGTKLSQHSKKRPFQPIRGEQGENYPGPDANNPSRENFFPQTTTHEPRSAHSPAQNSPSTRRVRPQPVQNSPHTRRVSPAIHKPTTHNPHKPAHKRRGPGRLTVCPAPGRSCNDAAQSLTA